jgi:predicted RNase H-like nuclease (RuvC/YqgF family)
MQTTENETQLKNSKLLSELELQKERCDSLESMVRRYEMERSLMKTAMDEKSQALKKLLSSNLTVRNYCHSLTSTQMKKDIDQLKARVVELEEQAQISDSYIDTLQRQIELQEKLHSEQLSQVFIFHL